MAAGASWDATSQAQPAGRKPCGPGVRLVTLSPPVARRISSSVSTRTGVVADDERGGVLGLDLGRASGDGRSGAEQRATSPRARSAPGHGSASRMASSVASSAWLMTQRTSPSTCSHTRWSGNASTSRPARVSGVPVAPAPAMRPLTAGTSSAASSPGTCRAKIVGLLAREGRTRRSRRRASGPGRRGPPRWRPYRGRRTEGSPRRS